MQNGKSISEAMKEFKTNEKVNEAKPYDLKVVVDATGESLLFVFKDYTGNAKSKLSKVAVGTENGVVYTNAQKKGSKEKLLKIFKELKKEASDSFAVSLPKNAGDRVKMIKSSADELSKKTKINGLLESVNEGKSKWADLNQQELIAVLEDMDKFVSKLFSNANDKKMDDKSKLGKLEKIINELDKAMK